ncbi:MAG: hypothetical protein HYW57_07605 [Ignavibacteriales bacterium]|nr:hypothetical protein [Ignavibacteriales bacterium]
MNRAILAGLCFFLLLSGCDGGLTPPPTVEPGIAGTLTVFGPWPPQDSVKSLWLFASQIFPLDSSKIVSGIFQGKIFVYPPCCVQPSSFDASLPYGFNNMSFHFPLPLATYFYIGVLQRFGDNLVEPRSYRVVGVLTNPADPLLPQEVTVGEFEVVSNLSINVDFYNLPPQPF